MPDERRAALAALARLRAEIREGRRGLETRRSDVRDVLADWASGPPSKPVLALAGVALHGWYTGLESLLERVVREIDREVPGGEASHRALLSQAMTEIEGLRPAILPRDLERDLVELLSFRHFFRHAYAVELDPDKLLPHLRCLEPLAQRVDVALDELDAFLAAAAAALTD